jgi:hypothetical protein
MSKGDIERQEIKYLLDGEKRTRPKSDTKIQKKNWIKKTKRRTKRERCPQ